MSVTSTTRVSTDSSGTQSNDSSQVSTVSANGRYVVFSSSASNLVAGDTNGQTDIFVKDTQTGAITRVSTAADGTQANGFSNRATISADGRYVVFQSSATNLVPGGTNGVLGVFLKDTVTGTVIRVDTAADGTQANDGPGGPPGVARNAVVSADGRYVAFRSAATNLVPNDTNGVGDVFVKDTVTGAITRASTATDGSQTNDLSVVGSISADGRYVTFTSQASNLVSGDTNGAYDVFVKDMATGTLTRVNTDAHGNQANGASYAATMSADGRYVAFDSGATNLVSNDTNGTTDVFVKDLNTGAVTLVSVTKDGTQGNNFSFEAAISADGTKVAFTSDASNLVAGDTNGTRDVFVKDLTSGTITRVSMAANGTQANGSSSTSSISTDGTRVSYDSNASNLVSGDTNNTSDIFESTINYSNTAPTAADDRWLVSRTTAVTAAASVLTANDSDPEGDTLTVTAVSNPVNATVALQNGQITFTTSADSSSFQYTVSDGQGGTANATVQVSSVATGNGADTVDASTYTFAFLEGGNGDDRLTGSPGDDVLSGGNGDDVLSGGGGRDTLTGGNGADTFRYTSPQEGGDTITDFKVGTDKLQIYSPNFGNLTPAAGGTLAAENFTANATGTATRASDRFVFNTTTGLLSYDSDGTGPTQAVAVATLRNGSNSVTTLSERDIALFTTTS